jgi:hypothetical protein
MLLAEPITRRHQTPLPELGVERYAPRRGDQRRARHRIERLTACTRQLVADLGDRSLNLAEERRDVVRRSSLPRQDASNPAVEVASAHRLLQAFPMSARICP